MLLVPGTQRVIIIISDVESFNCRRFFGRPIFNFSKAGHNTGNIGGTGLKQLRVISVAVEIDRRCMVLKTKRECFLKGKWMSSKVQQSVPNFNREISLTWVNVEGGQDSTSSSLNIGQSFKVLL